ncbi:hypothetical protein [Paeniglutamicibacter antarcticus]|uniref:hypothetical protein n=1 Tax=Paeniglutamicibacter antarcticus TaxID=494023 RepID=UPI003CD0AC91
MAGGWMIGDHPQADVAGEHAAALDTGWVLRRARRPRGIGSPTRMAASTAQLVDAVVRPGSVSG